MTTVYNSFTAKPSNPWMSNGRELLRIQGAIVDALTWKQYQRWTNVDSPRTYRSCFETVSKVTKNPKILALAAEGLALVELCESLESKRA